MAQGTILIVDDEKHTREGLRSAFKSDFEVYVAANSEKALALMHDVPVDVLLTDLRLGGNDDGMALMEKALKLKNPPECIMMTAYGTVDLAVEAMRRGAFDFVTKPVNIDRLEMLVRRALRERAVVEENRELRQQVGQARALDKMLGKSQVMNDVFATIWQVAPSRAAVLIEGETGTGKELAARAIHAASPRAEKPFVAVHCKAFSPQLLESELFGHERGAFTGAFERRIGRFEQAAGGTLFLDEIGEIDENTQVKILRVLGERTFERVGGNQTITTDVRLITATNKNLAELVAQEKFREDLFFRINVVQITMPPLRGHKEDIPLLAAAFLKEASRENEKPLGKISRAAMEALLVYDWPGNIRELRTAIEHAVVMSTGSEILPMDFPAAVRGTVATVRSEKKDVQAGVNMRGLSLHENERALIKEALDESSGNRTEAAKRLGISRRTLYRKLAETN